MTLKLIDLFETKFIGEQNIEYIELFKNIEVHPILNIIPEIRKQFILLVSIYHNNLFVINIFKKLYKNKEWKLDKLQYINSFCLSPSFENKYNWKDLENPEFLKNNTIDEGYFIINESYDRSILQEDYDFYIDLKNRYQHLSDYILTNLSNKIWGRTYNNNDIVWQVLLGNIITMLCGSGINELQFRSSYFKNINLMNLYYPNYNKNSIIYKNFTLNKMGICENCEVTCKMETGLMWNYPNYGDLCSICYNEKIEREKYRKDYFIRFIRSLGRRELFKKELENTKEFLKNNVSADLTNDQKYILMKKINENMLNSKKRYIMECSVCLEEMIHNIYAGNCGHCLHELCYFKLDSNKCPLCRKISNFKKLHI